jgi:hypothetical protein
LRILKKDQSVAKIHQGILTRERSAVALENPNERVDASPERGEAAHEPGASSPERVDPAGCSPEGSSFWILFSKSLPGCRFLEK